ncbi:slipin family protein [Leptospira sp. 201903070]|uniref:Slipin family protein n=1 Tax=Leptospira ainlahdjerensis TaxID=2810033 RepID=A0ABS2UDV5_9LEPT|nr:slipin family protein [Leptospira ainlahdjerensis]MBM9577954.1 slipin family protein [Leptospira ainlahdjerensis]
MKIKKNQRGFLCKDGEYVRLLFPGNYFSFFGETIEIHPILNPLSSKIDFAFLKNDPVLMKELEVIDLKDNEIALLFEEEKFKSVLRTGIHAFWKGVQKLNFITINLDDPFIEEGIERSVLMKPEVKDLVASYAIESYQKGLLFIENSFAKTLEPGNYFFWKGTKSISVIKADLRQLQTEVTGQEILSKDRIPLRLNFVCQYKITDPIQCLLEIKDYESQLYIHLQLVLREYIGSLTLDEILIKKEEIGSYVTEKIKTSMPAMGLEILFGGVKDVILPGEIKEILNQVLIAEKKAQANVIMRREETASTRSLLNTAKLMEENTTLYKLKELEYVERISEKISQITLTGGIQIIDQLKGFASSRTGER